MTRLKNFFQKNTIEVGCDEAGRGCLAGPVFAAAVILDPKKPNSKLNDSKKLSPKKRAELKNWIEENAIAWAVGQVSPKEIDQINILNASFLAMHRAIDQLSSTFDLILVDGNRFKPYGKVKHHCIIKGDAKYKCIAAASILAKTYRDDYMTSLNKKHPEYQWIQNFGYPTKKHREAIKLHGPTEYHRKSFKLLPDQLELNF